MAARVIGLPDHARVDREIGARIKARRVALGLTLAHLGRALDVSYQQVQKYESGVNRLSASSLVAVATALGVPAAALLDGLGRAGAAE